MMQPRTARACTSYFFCVQYEDEALPVHVRVVRERMRWTHFVCAACVVWDCEALVSRELAD